jgi:hypothetical protein
LADARRKALLRATIDPHNNPGLTLALEESRNDLRAMAAPLSASIAWSARETGNYVDLDDYDIGSRGGTVCTSVGPNGVKDGEEEKLDYIWYYY